MQATERRINVYFPEEQAKRVRQWARSLGISPPALIRMAVTQFLNGEPPGPRPGRTVLDRLLGRG